MSAYPLKLSDFIQRMAALGGEVEAAVIRGLQSSAMRLDGLVLHEIDHAKPYPAVDRGELRNSRKVTMTPRGARFEITAPHAPAIENGTRPFRPPTGPLVEWLLRKKLASDEKEAMSRAWAIANTIAKQGIAPRHFLKKAWERFIQGKHLDRAVAAELDKLAQKHQRGNFDARGRGTSGGSKKGQG